MLKIKQCPKNPNLASPIQKKNTTFFFKKLENSSYNLNNDKHKFIKLYLKTKKCKLPEELFLTKYIISKKKKKLSNLMRNLLNKIFYKKEMRHCYFLQLFMIIISIIVKHGHMRRI